MGRASEISDANAPISRTEYNALITDYLSQTDDNEQTIARLDHVKFNPISVPAALEGRFYYDSTTKKLMLRDDTEWLTIPGAGGGGGSAAKGSYSYIIYKSGSDYYAEDNEGNIVYGGSGDAGGVDGADACAVIQAANDALTNGGKIFIKAGTYDITEEIFVDTGNTVEGEGYGTYLLLNAASIPEQDRAILNGRYSPRAEKIVIRNLRIDGNDVIGVTGPPYAWFGIKARYETLIEGCFITRCTANGINSAFARNVIVKNNYVWACHSGIWIDYQTYRSVVTGNICWANTASAGIVVANTNGDERYHIIANNICYDNVGSYNNKGYGIFLYNARGVIVANNMMVGNGTSSTDGRGLTMDTVDDILITGNMIANNNDYGIAAHNAGNIRISNNLIFNNAGVGQAQTHGWKLTGTPTGTIELIDNRFYGLTASYYGISANEVWKRNFGLVTENNVLSGTFAIDSTGLKTVTVNHGCDYTPSVQDVQATISEDTDVDDWWGFVTKIKDISSTQVTIDVYVLDASATGAATAKVNVRIAKE